MTEPLERETALRTALARFGKHLETCSFFKDLDKTMCDCGLNAALDASATPPPAYCGYAIFHGPGHQSRTRCRVRGPHEVHEAIYGEFNQYATWRGESDASSGVFDEAPEADE